MARQQAPGRVKRREVESEDGWTVITHGVAGLKIDGKEKEKARAKGKGKKNVAGQMPSSTVKNLTLEKLLAEFEGLGEKWRDCPVARQIEKAMRQRGKQVTNAVCIGIGSFARDWEQRWRSLWQLVLFVHAVRRLDDKRIAMYAQDPAFTPLDIAFLKALDIATVQTGIETHVSPGSFVFSPFVDWFILLPTFLAGKNPAVYVGNEVLDDYSAYAQAAEKKEKLDECNRIGSTFLAGREKHKLAAFDGHAHAFNGMVVYLAELNDEGEGD